MWLKSEQVKHGAKSPAVGGIKDLKQAKAMDICTGLENLANDDQNMCRQVWYMVKGQAWLWSKNNGSHNFNSSQVY